MKNLLFILPVFLSLSLISCKKENSKKWTEVNIKANNYITGEPITDVWCGIVATDYGFLGSEKIIIIDTGFTENGVFSSGFKIKNKYTYYHAEATFDREKYYAVNFSNYLYFDWGEVNDFQFDLVPY